MADQDKSSLDANKGSVGSQFQPEGNVGQVGEKVGGPFSSKGERLSRKAMPYKLTEGRRCGGKGIHR
jgi:hypothetical protein